MEFYGWTVELDPKIIPYANDTLKKVIFVAEDDDPYYGGGGSLGSLQITDEGQLEITTGSLRITILGDKHLKLSAIEPITINYDETPENDEVTETE